MKSWQGPGGTSFYGNNFEPKESIVIPCDKWICYAEKHPDFLINTKTATVWFDDIVIAKKYIA